MFARALIVLLLALNVGVALWWWLRDEPVAPAAEPSIAGVPVLQLLAPAEVSDSGSGGSAASAGTAGGEATPSVADEATGEGAVPATSGSGVCVTLGPYPAEDIRAAQSRLRPLVERMTVRNAVAGARGWRVYLPALADREAATAMATRLREAGFDDLYVVADGHEANSISLGRFGAEASARSHAAALQAAGFDARAQALGDGGSQQWIDVVASGATAADALQQASDAAQMQMIDCDSVVD